MTAGLGLRTLGQAAVFLIVARVLGVEAYGAYSAVLALAMTLGGFTGLGVSVIMLRDTARDAEPFAESWGRTLAALLLTAPPLLAAFLILAWTILPASVDGVVIVNLGVAEIALTPLTLSAMQAYQGHERIGRAARVVLAPVLPRLAAAMFLPLALLLPVATRLPLWSAGYLAAAAASAVYTLWLLRRDFGLPFEIRWRGLGSALRAGWPFSVGGAAHKVYVDIDKLMLARMVSLETAGAYSAAYRVVDMAGVPLTAFFTAAAPRFFRAGQNHESGNHAATFAWKLLPLPAVYAVACAVLMYGLAGMLPTVLGQPFVSSTDVLKWLAWLPVVMLGRYFLQFILIGTDRQHAFMAILLIGAALNLGLNIWLIPWLEWRGAVLATYGAEVAMILMLGVAIAANPRPDGGCASTPRAAD